jgi:hypothetical protein
VTGAAARTPGRGIHTPNLISPDHEISLRQDDLARIVLRAPDLLISQNLPGHGAAIGLRRPRIS